MPKTPTYDYDPAHPERGGRITKEQFPRLFDKLPEGWKYEEFYVPSPPPDTFLPTGVNPTPADDDVFETNGEGAWVVYGWDMMPYPLFLHKEELKARRYQSSLGYPSFIKYWKFGDEFGTE